MDEFRKTTALATGAVDPQMKLEAVHTLGPSFDAPMILVRFFVAEVALT
jgi:hypothetical protein